LHLSEEEAAQMSDSKASDSKTHLLWQVGSSHIKCSQAIYYIC